MKKILFLLKTTMTVPEPFGAFHLVAIALVVILTLCSCLLFRNADERTFRIILTTIWAIMFSMEAVKQLTCSYSVLEDGSLSWRYNWGTFPLHLCDSPLYMLLPIAFLKDGKLRDALSLYTCTYVLIGGISTYVLISTTFCEIVYLNVQTLCHHGLQILAAVLIAVHFRKRLTWQAFRGAVLVFLSAVAIATLYNVVMHALVPDQDINMFYISPYFKKTMPILNDEWHALHWAPTILLYITGVTFIALLVFLLYKLILRSANQRMLIRDEK